MSATSSIKQSRPWAWVAPSQTSFRQVPRPEQERSSSCKMQDQQPCLKAPAFLGCPTCLSCLCVAFLQHIRCCQPFLVIDLQQTLLAENNSSHIHSETSGNRRRQEVVWLRSPMVTHIWGGRVCDGVLVPLLTPAASKGTPTTHEGDLS